MSNFTPEQIAEMDAKFKALETAITTQFAALSAKAGAEYTTLASRLREWIKAHPVPASNTALTVGFFIGLGVMRGLEKWLSF